MKKQAHHIRMSAGDRVFVTINGILLFLFFVATLYPLIFVLSASFSDPTAVATGKMFLFPINPTVQGYEFILQYKEIWTGYLNTLFYTVVGTMYNLFLTLPCAYALSRRDMGSRGAIMIVFMITMYFSGGLIPGYLNMQALGLLDKRIGLVLSSSISVYNLIVARTFFANSIPWELHEASFLDGCSDFRIFLKIVLPLSTPIIAVLTLYYAVGHWNSYFNAMIYLKDRAKYPLQVFLREILVQGRFAEVLIQSGEILSAEQMAELAKQSKTADMIKYGVIVVSTLPMMIVYPWMQKFFAKGVMIGSVKG